LILLILDVGANIRNVVLCLAL